MALKDQIRDDMKAAMRAGEKDRLSVIRMLLAAIQQREIDEREDLDDSAVMQVVEKLIKQRRDSAQQYADAGRADREQQELGEAELLATYLPEQLSDEAINELLDAVLAETGAASMKDMGKVMAELRNRAQGQADMGKLSGIVKQRLAG
ncbi:MAG: GatB/YqeY domain-containing protein [Gammaproteobacteria bacterium]